jgi:hypothetical protein
MRRIYSLSVLTFATILAVSCQRKNEPIPAEPNPVGGKGGNAELRVTAKHHEATMDSCTIYIRYDANAMPTDMKWDDTMNVKVENGRYMAVFTSLKKGSYFLYGKGWDFSLEGEDKTVTGWASFRIPDTAARVYDTYLNVSEIHIK